MKNKLILALSGNDIFSGGGLHADLATYTVHGLHGFVAVTCLTAMTDKGFEVLPTDEQVFAQQLSSLKDVPFSAIKLGLLPNVAIADQALEFIKKQAGIPVVLDPVLVCKETHDVEVSALRDELIKFFPYTTIITPNLPEAEILTQSEIKTLDDLKAAAVVLYELGAQNVVIKGGNRFSQDQALDLFYDGKDFVLLESPVLPNNNTGAGCTFASSIASQLLAGQSPLEAVNYSKDFVYRAIQRSDQYGVIQYEKKSDKKNRFAGCYYSPIHCFGEFFQNPYAHWFSNPVRCRDLLYRILFWS